MVVPAATTHSTYTAVWRPAMHAVYEQSSIQAAKGGGGPTIDLLREEIRELMLPGRKGTLSRGGGDSCVYNICVAGWQCLTHTR